MTPGDEVLWVTPRGMAVSVIIVSLDDNVAKVDLGGAVLYVPTSALRIPE